LDTEFTEGHKLQGTGGLAGICHCPKYRKDTRNRTATVFCGL